MGSAARDTAAVTVAAGYAGLHHGGNRSLEKTSASFADCNDQHGFIHRQHGDLCVRLHLCPGHLTKAGRRLQIHADRTCDYFFYLQFHLGCGFGDAAGSYLHATEIACGKQLEVNGNSKFSWISVAAAIRAACCHSDRTASRTNSLEETSSGLVIDHTGTDRLSDRQLHVRVYLSLPAAMVWHVSNYTV